MLDQPPIAVIRLFAKDNSFYFLILLGFDFAVLFIRFSRGFFTVLPLSNDESKAVVVFFGF